MRDWEKVWVRGGEREAVRGDKQGEKFTSTAGWSRKSCNLSEARKQKQMSHVSPSLIPPFIHLPPFFSPLPHSPDELALYFSFSLTPLFSLLSSASSFCLHLTALTLPPTHPFSSLMMSWAVWLVLTPDYSPQWAHFTPLGMMPASQPLVVLQLTDRRLLALYWPWLGCIQWTEREKMGGERNTGVWQVNFPPIRWIGWEKGEHVRVKQSGSSVWVSLKNCAPRNAEVCFGEAFLSDCVYLCAYVSVCVMMQNTKSQWYSQSLQTRSVYFIASLPLPVRAHYSPWKQ